MKKIFIMFILILIALPLTGCSIEGEMNKYRPVTDATNLEGRRIAVVIAWSEDYLLSRRDDVTVLRYESLSDAFMALSYKKVDAVSVDVPSAAMVIANLEGVKIIEPAIDETGMVYLTKSKEARDDFNDFLTYFKTTEEFNDIQNHIFDFHDVYENDLSEIKKYPGAKTIRVAMDDSYYPIEFYDIVTKSAQGYDAKIMKAYAEYRHYNLEIISGTYTSNLNLLNTGKIDFFCDGAVIDKKSDFEKAGIYVTDIVYMDKIGLIGLDGNKKMKYKN